MLEGEVFNRSLLIRFITKECVNLALCNQEITVRHGCCFYIDCRSKFYCTLYLPLVVFLLSLNILSRASIER